MSHHYIKLISISMILFTAQAMAVVCGGGAKEYLKLNPTIMSNNYTDIIGKLYDPETSINAKEIINNAVNEHYESEGFKTGQCSPFSAPETCETENCCKAYYPNVKCPKATTEDASSDIPSVVNSIPTPNTGVPVSDPEPDAMDPDL